MGCSEEGESCVRRNAKRPTTSGRPLGGLLDMFPDEEEEGEGEDDLVEEAFLDSEDEEDMEGVEVEKSVQKDEDNAEMLTFTSEEKGDILKFPDIKISGVGHSVR